MKVYIAGKVTGESPIGVYFKFDDRENKLTKQGYAVVNPVKKCKSNWSYIRCMAVCIYHLIFRCNKISLLDDWHDSRGARIECKIAMLLNYEIV